MFIYHLSIEQWTQFFLRIDVKIHSKRFLTGTDGNAFGMLVIMINCSENV